MDALKEGWEAPGSTEREARQRGHTHTELPQTMTARTAKAFAWLVELILPRPCVRVGNRVHRLALVAPRPIYSRIQVKGFRCLKPLINVPCLGHPPFRSATLVGLLALAGPKNGGHAI